MLYEATFVPVYPPNLFATKRLVFISFSWIAKIYTSICEDNGAFLALFHCCFCLYWQHFSWSVLGIHVGFYKSIHEGGFL